MQTEQRQSSAPQKKGLLAYCLNWKVLGGLAMVGLGLWVVAPNLVARALPLLLLAACPLSMLLMMRGMRHGTQSDASSHTPAEAESARGSHTQPALADKKAELARLQARQELLAREIAYTENGKAAHKEESKPAAPGE